MCRIRVKHPDVCMIRTKTLIPKETDCTCNEVLYIAFGKCRWSIGHGAIDRSRRFNNDAMEEPPSPQVEDSKTLLKYGEDLKIPIEPGDDTAPVWARGDTVSLDRECLYYDVKQANKKDKRRLDLLEAKGKAKQQAEKEEAEAKKQKKLEQGRMYRENARVKIGKQDMDESARVWDEFDRETQPTESIQATEPAGEGDMHVMLHKE